MEQFSKEREEMSVRGSMVSNCNPFLHPLKPWNINIYLLPHNTQQLQSVLKKKTTFKRGFAALATSIGHMANPSGQC